MSVTFKIVKFHSAKTNKDYPCLVADTMGENAHGEFLSRRTIISFDCKVLSRISSLPYTDLQALDHDIVLASRGGLNE